MGWWWDKGETSEIGIPNNEGVPENSSRYDFGIGGDESGNSNSSQSSDRNPNDAGGRAAQRGERSDAAHAFKRSENSSKSVVVDSIPQSIGHYLSRSGKSVVLGPNTQKTLRESDRIKAATSNLYLGKTAMNGSFSVKLSWTLYGHHVGSTNVDYTTSCNESVCKTQFVGFARDGFWDAFHSNSSEFQRDDGLGPNYEFIGEPYRYEPYEWTVEYPRPVNWIPIWER